MTQVNSRRNRLPHWLRALEYRNFRFYFFGQTISFIGSWIQQVAMSWLVYRLTGSAALLGITAFCALAPQLLVGPLAGAWVDKQDKKKWLTGVQGFLALQGFLLAILTWAEMIGPGFLIVMSLILGLLNSLEAPLRQALISSFVDRKDDLSNALALNAMLFNIGRSIGPPIAGLLLGLTSEAACFAINGCSFLLVMIGFVFMKITAPPRATGSMGDVFREGIRYAWDNWSVRILILTLIALNFTASAYVVLLPVLARDVLAGDATTLGWLWGAVGCGALAATFVLATRKSERAIAVVIVCGLVITAASLILLALCGSLTLAMVAMTCLGAGTTMSNVGVNMTLQSNAPERLRGRVISFFTSARFGFDAIGGLLAGFIATALGANNTLLIEGFILLLFVVFLLKRQSRLLSSCRS